MKPQRVLIFISVLLLLLVTARTTVKAQTNVKAGVVRIENTKHNEIGAGIIVKIVDTRAYVVTAAHVVRGEPSPRVYLFDGREQALSATIIDIENDDVTGLALLVFSPTPQTLSLLAELKLAATSNFGNGESITFIGFPGTNFWTVDTGNIKRLEGKNLVLSGSARQGNSGGPVVLNQHVAGLVTDVKQSDIYAARAETIAIYVNGFILNRVTLADLERQSVVEFCEALTKLVDASKDNFYSIVGEPLAFGAENQFYSEIFLPGADKGFVEPRKQVYHFLLKDNDATKVKKEFYHTVVRVKRCFRDWNDSEAITGSWVHHRFNDPKGSALVELSHDAATLGMKALILSIYPDKAKRDEPINKNAEIGAKNAEIEATNKKITQANEIVSRTFKAGNEALMAASMASKAKKSEEAIQKYTVAVALYDEGLPYDAEQPAILTNKAVALKGRGVERFNATITSKTLDAAGKSAGREAAKEDFKAAAETAGKAVTMIKAQPVPTEPNEVARYKANKYAAMLTHAESMRLYVSKANVTQVDAGVAAFKDYLAVEMDPGKKAKAQLDMAQMLLDAGAAEKALTEFKVILATTPDSPDANLGAGLAVYATGDKTKFQEVANFLQRFVEVAPDSHPMRDDAKAVLAALKDENIIPEKTSKPAHKRP